MPTILVELSHDAVDKLERLSLRNRVSHHALAEQAIEAFIDTEEWQLADIEAGLAEAHRGNFVSEEQAGLLFRQFIG